MTNRPRGFRQCLARVLRKWADLIDPRQAPSDPLTITINCDTTDFHKEMDRALARVEELKSASEGITPPVCQHNRQKWMLDMSRGTCIDCGLTLLQDEP